MKKDELKKELSSFFEYIYQVYWHQKPSKIEIIEHGKYIDDYLQTIKEYESGEEKSDKKYCASCDEEMTFVYECPKCHDTDVSKQ